MPGAGVPLALRTTLLYAFPRGEPAEGSRLWNRSSRCTKPCPGAKKLKVRIQRRSGPSRSLQRSNMARACGVCRLPSKEFPQERNSSSCGHSLYQSSGTWEAFRTRKEIWQSARTPGLMGGLASRSRRAPRSLRASVGGPRHRPTRCKRRAFQSRRSSSRRSCPGEVPKTLLRGEERDVSNLGGERGRRGRERCGVPPSACKFGSAAPPRAPGASRRSLFSCGSLCCLSFSVNERNPAFGQRILPKARAGERTSRR